MQPSVKSEKERLSSLSSASGRLTQDNLYLLLPGKVLAVAQMYARHHQVSVLDALRKVYASDMYKELEQESTKRWHEGPVSLYESMEGI